MAGKRKESLPSRIRKLFVPLRRSDIENDEHYKAVCYTTDTFKPIEGKSYQWVYGHGMKLAQIGADYIDTLDKKAENFIKFLGPTSGIIGFAIVWLFRSEYSACWWLLIPIAISIIGFILGLFLSISSLMPFAQPTPPPTKDALECIDHYKTIEEAYGKFAKGFDILIVAQEKITTMKARRINAAFWFFVFGFILLILTLFAFAFLNSIGWSCC